MNDCLLIVDVFNDFTHDDGDRLLGSLRERSEGFAQTLSHARDGAVPIVYANDSFGVWDGDARALVGRAVTGPAGDILARLSPAAGDAFILKPRYSAFDLTPLELVLAEQEIERVMLMGMATEMCVTQTAIDARERGFKVTVITGACATVDRHLEETALEYLAAVTGTMLAPSMADVSG